MILIVGSTGTVGRYAVQSLVSQSIPVRALTRNTALASFLPSPHLNLFEADLSEPESVRPALQGIERVLLITPSCPQQVEWETNVINAAVDAGVQQIVKLSTLGALVDSNSKIARWHGEIEKVLTDSGIPHTILRCHNFFQNLSDHIPAIHSEGIIRAPLADARIAMIDARDIAEFAVVCLTHDGHTDRIYRLTGGEAITYSQVAETISEVIGKPVRYQSISDEEARQDMQNDGLPDWEIEDMIGLYRQFREGGGARIWGDFPEVMGRRQRTFREFVEGNRGRFK